MSKRTGRAAELDGFRVGFATVLLAWFPAFVAFIVIPFSLYLPNQADFDYDLRLLGWYAGVAGALLFATGLLFAFEPAKRARIATILFVLGAYLALSDVLCPVQLGEIPNGVLESPLPEPWRLDLLDAGLGLLAICAMVLLPFSGIRTFGSVVVVTLLLTQGASIWKGLAGRAPGASGRATELCPPPAKLTEKGNVYHIVFDGFSGFAFPPSLEMTDLAEAFEGFVFFKNNHANYLTTWLSFASFMTGGSYDGGRLSDWMSAWFCRRDGLIQDLYANGFEVTQYTFRYSHANASHVYHRRQISRSYRAMNRICFADLWLLRLAPHGLHQETYTPQGGLFSRFHIWRTSVSPWATAPFEVDVMRQLIADEQNRPARGQYIWAHLLLPHPPYVMNSEGQRVAGQGWLGQSACTVQLMSELIDELKRLGRFDSSLIIFQADHGEQGEEPSGAPEDYAVAPGVGAEIERRALSERSFKHLVNRARALLLVKPPGGKGALEESPLVTQLMDIPATVFGLLDLPVQAPMGGCIFDVDLPGDREVHVYDGFHQRGKDGQWYGFGGGLSEGQMNHYGVQSTGEWVIHQNIDIKW